MIDIDSLLRPYGPASSYATGGDTFDTAEITVLEPVDAPAVIDVAPTIGKHRAEVPTDSKIVEVVPIQIGRLSA